MMNNEEFLARDYVYCGVVFFDNSLSVVICQINENGELAPANYYDYKKSRDKVISGIYRGASFSDTSARGIDNAIYQGYYSDNEKIISWKARNDQARTKERTAKLEKDAKRINEIDNILLPLRKIYAGYRKKNDYAGIKALQNAVLRSLQTPIRQSENI